MALLIPDRPPNSFTHLSKKKKKERKNCDMWHMTCDMWHVTCCMWHVTCHMSHVTCDTWHVTAGSRWKFSKKIQLPSSYGLEVCGDIWHLTCDTYLKPDTWHVTHDIWYVSCDTLWTNIRSLAVLVWVWRCLDDSEVKDHWMNEWIIELIKYLQRCL